MRPFHTLYAKIFGWFWLTIAVGALLVIMVTAFTGTQPLGRRWMRLTQDMYAHSAVDFYKTGGRGSLAAYLAVLKNSSGMDAALLDEHQQDVLGRQLPPHVHRVIQESINKNQSTFRLGRTWTAATPVPYDGRQFLFVIEVQPGRSFDGTFVVPALERMFLALLIAAVFCMFLARHIVAPVRALQIGAQRLAAGDLSTRVSPGITPRNDELADTARAFDQMAEHIQVLIQKRQELLADISHELRSPLTRLSLSLELVLRGETDAAKRMQIDVERMNAMIGQIMLMTRLDTRPPSVNAERVEIRTILQGIAHDAEFEAQREGKTVEVKVDESCIVDGDTNLLWSCIENIVRNAIRHSAPNTAVTATACIRKMDGIPICELVITDCGPGVPEESVPYLFDPFFRISEARSHDEGGTGLGLSISRRIAELHRGTIRAENLKDRRGLKVTLLLPAC